MNKQQRKRLNELIEHVEGIVTELDEMAQEEQEKYDNMPEGLQESERGEALQDAADNLQQAHDDLENWCDEIRDNLEL